MAQSKQLAVVGLGLMGTAMTERLMEHGWQVVVWNRTQEKAAPLIALGAKWSDRPFADADRVIISLYTSDVVEQVLEEHDADLRPGQILVDTTTGEPAQSRVIAERLAARGVHYVDAPISGSSEQTRNGEATVIVGGDRSVFESCADLWPILGAKIFYSGPSGSAAKMKLISNLVLGLNRAVLAEGLAFAEAIDVDPGAALEVLRGSMAYSKAMDAKGRKMIEGDFRVQARLSQHLKDVRLMLEAAQEAGIALPFTTAHKVLMEQAEAEGLGDLDNSVILKVLQCRQS